MKLNLRWEPRWPAFAIGFYRGKRTAPYTMFHIILWPVVIEFDWGKK